MSQDEIVDIVNQNDKVIGTVSKGEAHEKGLLHRTVIAEIIGSDGKWTLVKQAADRQDADQFVSPVGGHVQSGETLEDALKREANEEYGLSSDFQFKLIGKRIFNREVNGKKENHLFILYEIYTDASPVLNAESIAFERYTKEEIQMQIGANPEKFGAAFHFVLRAFY